jgi:hypothetical protein
MLARRFRAFLPRAPRAVARAWQSRLDPEKPAWRSGLDMWATGAPFSLEASAQTPSLGLTLSVLLGLPVALWAYKVSHVTQLLKRLFIKPLVRHDGCLST